MTDQEEKIKLFESDGEEEEYDDFKIRPQYQGPHGQQILELNSQLSKRFKLDERFAEDFEPEGVKGDEKNLSEGNEEMKKNIRILETILGHEVCTKTSDKSFIKKKQIRFDPDDETASKFIKASEITVEKPKKSKKRKAISEDKVEPNIPISTERYTEVCPDLKELLNNAAPFSFSQKFSYDAEPANDNSQIEVSPKFTKEINTADVEKKNRSEINIPFQNKNFSTDYFTPKSKCDSFFITEGDARLKEGIEFFKRPKPLEEIRTEWQRRREHVLELFRRKRKSSQRSHSTRVKSMQIKNSIRKNDFIT